MLSIQVGEGVVLCVFVLVVGGVLVYVYGCLEDGCHGGNYKVLGEDIAIGEEGGECSLGWWNEL